MASKLIVVLCIQLSVFNAVYSQCVNRVVPNCGCSNILPVAETILPNQVLVNQLPNFLPNQYPNIIPNQILYNPLPAVETVIPSPVATTTIIQDSTVANNLANALQLLVVSNLLSNTLPCAGPVEVLPGYRTPVEVLPGYGAPIEVFPGYGAPIEVLPGYGAPIEVLPRYGAPFEVVTPYTSVSPCGCGRGGYNYIY